MDGLFGAIEGGGTKFLCAVGRGPSHTVAEARIVTRDPEHTLDDVVGFFRPHAARLRALGIGCFGPLELNPRSAAYGRLLATPKAGWEGADVVGTLARALQLPIAIDTDVNAAALAEQRWGALRGVRHGAYITVGTGVGVGVLVDGKPLHGMLHPELGHLRVPDRGAPGVCPFHGACVEGLVSGPAIRARTGMAPEALPDDHPVWPAVADTLAELVHAVVLAYAPERVVLGGGVLARAGLLERIRAGLVRSLAGYVPRAGLTAAGVSEYLVAPGLAERAGLCGGFALAEDVVNR